MPVRKFRDVSEIPEIWHPPGSPELNRAIKRVWDFAQRTAKRSFPHGVYKHRSVEEAEVLKRRWRDENARAHRARQEAAK